MSEDVWKVKDVVSGWTDLWTFAQVWPLTQDLNGLYLAGSFLLPYSWALHVASWIQKNNGK